MSYAERALIQVSRPVKDQLDKIQNEQRDKLKRQVSYSEILEDLLEFKQAFTRMSETMKEVGLDGT